MSDQNMNQDIDNLLEDCRQEHEFQERMARLQEPDDLARVTAQRDRMREVLQEVLVRVERISESHWWIDCPDKGGIDVAAIRAALALSGDAQ